MYKEFTGAIPTTMLESKELINEEDPKPDVPVKAEPVNAEVPDETKTKKKAKKAESVKVNNPVMSVSPIKEGDGKLSSPQVFLVVDNNAVLVASQATIDGSDLTISTGVCDGVFGRKLLKPLSRGLAVEPTYRGAVIEVYVLGDVKKRLTNISIKEFVTSNLTDGRMAILKLQCKFKGIEDSPHCPYPVVETLKPKMGGQTVERAKVYTQRDTRVPIGDIPMKTATQLY